VCSDGEGRTGCSSLQVRPRVAPEARRFLKPARQAPKSALFLLKGRGNVRYLRKKDTGDFGPGSVKDREYSLPGARAFSTLEGYAEPETRETELAFPGFFRETYGPPSRFSSEMGKWADAKQESWASCA